MPFTSPHQTWSDALMGEISGFFSFSFNQIFLDNLLIQSKVCFRKEKSCAVPRLAQGKLWLLFCQFSII